jgi:AcrR family transcriptional regulator
MFMPRGEGSTKMRLLAAGTRLFAERGFHATSVREIAERARVNVASGNYHYGSKRSLYLEVLREQFRSIRAELERRGAAPSPEELSKLSRAQLENVLHTRILGMCEVTLGPPPAAHGALMQREMMDPSEALPVIVTEFIVPMTEEMAQIVARLFSKLTAHEVEQCVNSIVGQAMFHRFAMPALLHMQGRKTYPRTYAKELAEHITEFSLGGAKQISERRTRKARAR